MTKSFASALAQLNPRLGDVAGNIDRLAKARIEAAKNGAAVIVTPEMYLSGYPAMIWCYVMILCVMSRPV